MNDRTVNKASALGFAVLLVSVAMTGAPLDARPTASNEGTGSEEQLAREGRLTDPTGVVRVNPDSSLSVRQGPGRNYSEIATLANGTIVRIKCQAHGSLEAGNVYTTRLWNQIVAPARGYVSDAFYRQRFGCPRST